ncbi:MAG TPA: formyltransferase family protein [Ktedonobacterales bacterium]|nr:formyltransferase family protein [Ktedonobacterales bacterium]
MNRRDDAQSSAPSAAVRVVFCGMTGIFSLVVLEGLLWAGVEVVAVALPALRAREGQPPLLLPRRFQARGIVLAGGAPRTILDLAAERDIPVLELGGPHVPDALAALDFDAITVACFTRRLPASLLRLPRLGCLNVHPSLLPAHRGPDPLFWIFREGDEAGGVTIHLMDEGFDTGPIVLQENVALSDDMTEAMLDLVCARRGGALLAEALAALNEGIIQPQPQDASSASYQSWPTEDDYTITPAWSARRAYRFIHGVGGRGEPIRFVADDGATFVVHAALEYDAAATLDAPWRLDDGILVAQCAPGVLRCRIAM